MSPRTLRGPVSRLLQSMLGVPVREPERLNRAYVERTESEISASRHVRQAVLLALDGVYDSRGLLDLERTHLYVPNDAVLDLARRYPVFLAGVSVNPRRGDALDELARVVEAGAALNKWLPNTQLFDPADPAYRPFLRQMARRRLPLLVHSGVEVTLVAGFQKGGDPARWRPALEEGVEVIAAHGGSSGLPCWERHARTFFSLLERYPNLHADSSALTIPSRSGMLRRWRRRPQALGRLTFGTDYPLPSFPSLLLARLSPRAYLAARRERNYFDRQVRVLQGLGWEPSSQPLEKLLARLHPDP